MAENLLYDEKKIIKKGVCISTHMKWTRTLESGNWNILTSLWRFRTDGVCISILSFSSSFLCVSVWAGHADTHQSDHQRPPGTWAVHHRREGQNLCKGEGFKSTINTNTFLVLVIFFRETVASHPPSRDWVGHYD